MKNIIISLLSGILFVCIISGTKPRPKKYIITKTFSGGLENVINEEKDFIRDNFKKGYEVKSVIATYSQGEGVYGLVVMEKTITK